LKKHPGYFQNLFATAFLRQNNAAENSKQVFEKIHRGQSSGFLCFIIAALPIINKPSMTVWFFYREVGKAERLIQALPIAN
jgi:hypothetical protein